MPSLRVRCWIPLLFVAAVTSCGDDSNAAPPKDGGAPVSTSTTAEPAPSSTSTTVEPVETTVVDGGDDAAASALSPGVEPLADGDLLRMDNVDCDGSCEHHLLIRADGTYRLTTGDGDDWTGTLAEAAASGELVVDPDELPATIAGTDFDSLRADVSDSCDDAEENFLTRQEFQFSTATGTEVVIACGPAPGGSALLAQVLVLWTDLALLEP